MPELIPAAPGSPEWLAARRAGVTATDIVTILGLSSWSSAYSLFWQKMGQVPETPDNDRFRLSRELEPYVLARWLETVDMDAALSGRNALYRNSDRSWQMATLDAEWSGKPVEVKTWADADRHTWADTPPATVRAQVLWQMDVMGVAVGHVGVVFLPSGEFRSYTIEHPIAGSDPACSVCTDILLMRAAGEEFMARLRLELPAPDPDASAASLAAVRARFAKAPDKTAEINPDVWYAFEQARDDLDAAKAEAYLWEINVREQAGEASVLTVNGQPVARRITGDAQVKAHVRHNDYLRRIKQETDSE